MAMSLASVLIDSKIRNSIEQLFNQESRTMVLVEVKEDTPALTVFRKSDLQTEFRILEKGTLLEIPLATTLPDSENLKESTLRTLLDNQRNWIVNALGLQPQEQMQLVRNSFQKAFWENRKLEDKLASKVSAVYHNPETHLARILNSNEVREGSAPREPEMVLFPANLGLKNNWFTILGVEDNSDDSSPSESSVENEPEMAESLAEDAMESSDVIPFPEGSFLKTKFTELLAWWDNYSTSELAEFHTDEIPTFQAARHGETEKSYVSQDFKEMALPEGLKNQIVAYEESKEVHQMLRFARSKLKPRKVPRCYRAVKLALLNAGLIDHYPAGKKADDAIEGLKNLKDLGFINLMKADPKVFRKIADAPHGAILVYRGGKHGHIEIYDRANKRGVSDFLRKKILKRRRLVGIFVKDGVNPMASSQSDLASTAEPSDRNLSDSKFPETNSSSPSIFAMVDSLLANFQF